jgi:hypothetical protein
MRMAKRPGQRAHRDLEIIVLAGQGRVDRAVLPRFGLQALKLRIAARSPAPSPSSQIVDSRLWKYSIKRVRPTL